MSVTLQIKLNGGAPQVGAVVAVSGDSVQLTAASKATWGAPAAEWRIHSFPEEFSLPAGWSSDASGYYYLSNSDPPAFSVDQSVWWGKLGITITAMDGGVQVSDTATALLVRSPAGLRGIFKGEGAQFGGNREQWVKELNRDLRVIDVASVAGPTTAIPDATTATLTAKRGSRAALTRFRVQEITLPDGTVDGQPKTADLDGDVFSRTHHVNPDGSTAGIVGGGKGYVPFTWDATAAKWRTHVARSHAKIVRPEDFGDGVGFGDAAADTAAIQAMLDAVEVALADYSNKEAAGLVIEFSAPEYLLNSPIVFPSRWGWGGYEVRGATSAPGKTLVGGVKLRNVGAEAVLARRVTVTFNRAARTAVLSSGTWSGLGFAVGMRLFPYGTASNDRITKPIATLVGATATFEAPIEATVAGFSTVGVNPVDEVSVTCDIEQFNPFIATLAAWGVYIHDLKIDNTTAYPGGRGIASHALWIGFEQDVSGLESCSGVRLERVDVFGSRNHQSSAAILIGRPDASPTVGQQCDNIQFSAVTAQTLSVETSQSFDVSGDTLYTLATATHTAVTWTRSTTTATVTHTAHGYSTGAIVNVTVTSDAAAITLGQKTITVTGANTYTFTCLNAGGASGTLTVVRSAAHTFDDYQPVLLSFSTGGLMAAGLECKIYYARSVNKASGTFKVSATPTGAIITPSTSGGGTMTVREAYMASAVCQGSGNNHKKVGFENCNFSVCWNGFLCRTGFENLTFDTCGFDTIDSWAIDAPANFRVVSAIAERVAKFARAAPAHATIEHCSINTVSLDDDWDGVYAESITMVDSTYNDARTNLNITAINTGTDTLTVDVLAGFPPVDGRRVNFRSELGTAGFPDGPAFSDSNATDFYLRDVAHVSGATYTCKVATSIGGAAENLASSGALAVSDYLSMGSELVPQAYRGAQAGAFATIHRCTFQGSNRLRVGVGSAAPNALATHSSVSIYQADRPRIVASENIGGPQGYPHRIPDVNEETLSRQTYVSYQPQMLLLAEPVSQSHDEQIWQGDFSRWAAYMADPTMFFMFPPRVQVESIWAEVIPDRNAVTGFAASGLTALTCSVGVYTGGVSDGSLLPSFDLMAYSAKTITASSWVGGVATYTAATHKISAGDYVTVAGVTPSGYNATGRALTTAATWTRVTTTATVTSVAHGYATGQTIDVLACSSLGAIPLGASASTITVATADTFTFTCTNGGAASGTLSMINRSVFKLAVEIDPGGVGTAFGTVTVNANSRRRGMEAQTRGASAQTLPWRPIDLATPANHWTSPTQAITLTLSIAGAAWSALTAGRLRFGFRLGRFSR